MTVLNAKGKPFTWSYSALTDFEGCPARFAARRFYCTTVEAETEEMKWGNRVHKAFEERIRDGKAFHPDLAAYEPWARVLERLPGEKFVERKFAVRKNHHPCGFFDADAYGRGVIDLLVIDGDTATIIDYKTGKKKDDETQLDLFAWFVVNEFDGRIKKTKSRYIWLKYVGLSPAQLVEQKIQIISGKELGYLDAKMVMNKMLPRIETMERAWDEENFPCFPSGLCGWCPVEECVHWRPRR